MYTNKHVTNVSATLSLEWFFFLLHRKTCFDLPWYWESFVWWYLSKKISLLSTSIHETHWGISSPFRTALVKPTLISHVFRTKEEKESHTHNIWAEQTSVAKKEHTSSNKENEFTYHSIVMCFTLPVGNPIKRGLWPILHSNSRFGKRCYTWKRKMNPTFPNCLT